MCGGWESEETIAWVVGLLACDRIRGRMRDLDVDGIPAHEAADLFRVFFVHPRF